ncbi:MAG: hypothetical protein FJ145_13760 [Deltaproteobacteria bacterium]|nr:hypothetical protein [Deltaproteobacteria bacterium]
MTNKPQYDHELRALGQALEAEGITVFEMKSEAGKYVVSGAPEKPTSLLAKLKQLKKKEGARTLSFMAQDLLRLQWQGQHQRKTPNTLPDFYNLSNTLRTIGAYLDAQNAELLGIEKRPLSLTLLYKNDDGHPHVEDRTIASFYEIFVERYGQRQRSSSYGS